MMPSGPPRVIEHHRVTVTAATRHGKRNLRSIDWVKHEGYDDGEWWVWAGQSWRPYGWGTRTSERHSAESAYQDDALRQRRLAGRGDVIRLGRDIEVPLVALRIICDALRGAGIAEIDIEDVKTVMSKYGSRLVALEKLPGEQRRHATALLHREIASVVVSSHRQ